MNIKILRERKIQVIKTGKIETQQDRFCCFDVDDSTSKDIMSKKTLEGQIETYIEFILDTIKKDTFPIYADGDYFCQGEPLYYEEVNVGQQHIDEFIDWLEFSLDDGYEIKFDFE